MRLAEPLPVPPAPVQARLYVAVPDAEGVTVAVPLVVCVPLQPPLAVQLVALVEDQESVAFAPTVMLVGATEIVTVGCGGAVTVRLVEPFPVAPAPVQASV